MTSLCKSLTMVSFYSFCLFSLSTIHIHLSPSLDSSVFLPIICPSPFPSLPFFVLTGSCCSAQASLKFLDSPILPLLSAGITNLFRHAQTISVSESHKTVSCYFLIFILPFVFLILNQPLLVLRKCLGTNCLECVTHQKRHPAMCCGNKSILEPTSATLDVKAEPFTPCLLKDACVLSQAPLHLCSSLSDSHNQKTEMSGLLRQSQQLMRQV